MPSPKRATRETYIQIACTHEQKARIKEIAHQAGAKTLNQYALTLLLEGNTEEFGFLRRKAEGALVNADTYRQLRTIAEALKSHPDASSDFIQEAISIVKTVGRDIGLARLTTQVQQQVEQRR